MQDLCQNALLSGLKTYVTRWVKLGVQLKPTPNSAPTSIRLSAPKSGGLKTIEMPFAKTHFKDFSSSGRERLEPRTEVFSIYEVQCIGGLLRMHEHLKKSLLTF
jgi:hypothetical protein